eukprot:2462254-Amphidinium_carterae.1
MKGMKTDQQKQMGYVKYTKVETVLQPETNEKELLMLQVRSTDQYQLQLIPSYCNIRVTVIDSFREDV